MLATPFVVHAVASLCDVHALKRPLDLGLTALSAWRCAPSCRWRPWRTQPNETQPHPLPPLQAGLPLPVTVMPDPAVPGRCSSSSACSFTHAAVPAACQDAVLAINENGHLFALDRATAASLWTGPLFDDTAAALSGSSGDAAGQHTAGSRQLAEWPGAQSSGAWSASLVHLEAADVTLAAVQLGGAATSSDSTDVQSNASSSNGGALQLTAYNSSNGTLLWSRYDTVVALSLRACLCCQARKA